MHPEIDVSLVITNFNRADFLDRSVRSCLEQIIFRKNIEVIVVDDCSTDDSIQILKQFEPEIRVFRSEVNCGVAHASNVGLAEARGRYWMRVDADDFLTKLACSYMTSVLDENPEFGYVFSDHFRVDTRGFKIEKVKLDNQQTLLEHGAGVMFRTSAIKSVNGYDESLRNCEDMDLLLRVMKKFNGFHIPIALYRYYIHGGNITLSPERQEFRKIVEQRHGI